MTSHFLYNTNSLLDYSFSKGGGGVISELYSPVAIIYLFMGSDTVKTGKRHLKF